MKGVYKSVQKVYKKIMTLSENVHNLRLSNLICAL